MKNSLLTLAVVALGTTIPASAAITPCVANPGTAISNYNSSTNGCNEGNTVFDNFNTTGSSTATGTTDAGPAATAINLLAGALGTYTPASQTVTGLQIILASTGWQIVNTSNNQTLTSVINFSSSFQTQPNGRLTSMGLSAVAPTGFDSTDTGSIHIDICYGSNSPVTGTFNLSNCQAAGGSAIEFINFAYTTAGGSTPTITSSDSNSATLTAPANIAVWSTRVTINLSQSNTTGDATIAFSNLTLTFADSGITPEPATFGLMGAALAGLGILAHRRKRA